MSAAPVRRVVVVGGGTAGWMAATAIAKILGPTGLAVTLVESEAIGTVGVGEATIPPILRFNALVGIDEAAFVAATQATYKLGIEFVDWTRRGHRYFHPFGVYGVDLAGVGFQHFWLRGATLGDTAPLGAYSLTEQAAYRGRFMHPEPARPNSPVARISYAFQFDAGLYATYLRGLAERLGVVRVEGRVAGVELAGDRVDRVRLDDGRTIGGDLFIDCSGFRGLLIEGALASGYVDWSDWLPCDRAVAVPCARVAPPLPYTRATARDAGWQWRIPLQHRTGNGYVYCSRFLSDDAAAATLLASLDGEAGGTPRQLRFTAGHRRAPWTGNVVALGLAAGFLEPLESTSIHLVQSGIQRLLGLWPSLAFDACDRDRFNRQTIDEYTGIRDMLVLHYRATERDDTPFWRHCRSLPVPDGLARKTALYAANGRIARDGEELFSETSWLAVMNGQGVRAGAYSRLADVLPEHEVRHRLADMRQVIANCADAMPPHAAALIR